MKSKIALEVLRYILKTSLDVFSRYASTDQVIINYTFDETETLNLTIEGKNVKAYGLLIEQTSFVDGQVTNKKLWLRRYPIIGSLNEVKYQAFKELFDVIVGNFIVNATRADQRTLEALSNTKEDGEKTNN